MPGAYLGPRPTNTRQSSFDSGKAVSGVGSFVANELLGIDDMKNAVQHAKEGNWAGVAKSGLAIGAELGGTLAAGAAIGLSGGAATPGVAALYAGKVASKKAGKEAIEEVVGKTAKSKAEEATLKALKAKDKQEQKAAIKNNKLDRLDVMNKSPQQLANDTLESLNPFKLGKGNGSGKGTNRDGTGSGSGSGTTGTGSGGTGTSGSGFQSGGIPDSRGPGGRGGTATLERTDTRVTTGGPGGRGGAPEPERLTPPKVEQPKPNPYFGKGSGTAVERESDTVTKIGADTTPSIKPVVPDAAPKAFNIPRILGGISVGLGSVASTFTDVTSSADTKITTPTTTGTDSGIGGANGPGGRREKDLDIDLPDINVGKQDVKLQRIS
jgi:hypothetical protein